MDIQGKVFIVTGGASGLGEGTARALAAKGGKVVREAGPMMHGSTVIAFVEDPDGYKIEFIQKHSGADSVQYQK